MDRLHLEVLALLVDRLDLQYLGFQLLLLHLGRLEFLVHQLDHLQVLEYLVDRLDLQYLEYLHLEHLVVLSHLADRLVHWEDLGFLVDLYFQSIPSNL
jgi:hypothetical protein